MHYHVPSRIPSAQNYRAYLRSCGYKAGDVDYLCHQALSNRLAFLIWVERIDDGERVLRCVGRDERGHLFIRTPTATELRIYRRGLIKRSAQGKRAA